MGQSLVASVLRVYFSALQLISIGSRKGYIQTMIQVVKGKPLFQFYDYFLPNILELEIRHV